MIPRTTRGSNLRVLLSGRARWATLAALILSLALTNTASAVIASRKISGDMPAFGDVVDVPLFQVSPDSR
jgi:hypothetical protein